MPVDLRFGSTTSDAGVYRRDLAANDLPSDYNVKNPLHVLEVKQTDGNPLAVAFFFGCHPTTMISQEVVSADFPGWARAKIEQSMGGGKALFFQGFGGDMNPSSGPGGASAKKATGENVANAVTAKLGSGTMQPLQGELLFRNIQVDMYLNTSRPPYPDASVPGQTLPVQVATLQIGSDPNVWGSWTLVALSNEVVREQADHLAMRWSPATRITMMGYTNGVGSYLPTRAITERDQAAFYGQGQGWTQNDYEGAASFYYTWHQYAPSVSSDLMSWRDDRISSRLAPRLHTEARWSFGGGTQGDSVIAVYDHDGVRLTWINSFSPPLSAVGPSFNPDWKIVGAGDYNEDGKTDIVWWNEETAQVWFMYMDSTTVIGGTFGPGGSKLRLGDRRHGRLRWERKERSAVVEPANGRNMGQLPVRPSVLRRRIRAVPRIR
ncbi:MAG: hypothetical protein QM820_06445 [Minicystis sp.]